MRLHRKIEEKLMQWKDSSYALLLLGARQVGKTYILKDFISTNFSSYAFLSFQNNIPLIKAVLSARDFGDFLLRLSAFTTGKIEKGCCVFIDEIQEFYTYLERHPEIEEYFDLLSAMKDIGSNGYDVRFALSGSLLRLHLERKVNLFPEGSLLKLNLYPLDFEEFLWARGLNEELIELARKCIEAKEEVPEYLHERLIKEFELYLLVGGMPHAVSEFMDFNSFQRVELAHKTIDDFIRLDITKYAPDDGKIKIESIYELLPRELSSPTKRFVLSSIKDHKKNEQEYLNFGWLSEAGVAILSNAVSEPVAPLKASSSLNKVKLFHEDVGLLTYLLMDSTLKQRILSGETSTNYGAIYENAVAEILHSHEVGPLYYFFKKGIGDADFLLERGGEVILLEIKSGKDYSRLSALKNLLSTPNYSFKGARVYYNQNVMEKDDILYLPIYAIEFLR
ncbi:MAG: ATP-binding protein [Bacilli bacterium]|nr:ATP-binding protein [Bacilli bacterium]